MCVFRDGVMFKSIVIYILFIIAFFGKSLEQYNLAPPFLNWATEPLTYFVFLLALITLRQRIRLPLLGLMIVLLLIGSVSTVFNNRFSLEVLFAIRIIVRFYLLFLAVVNLGLSEVQFKKINHLLALLFILQIPVAVVKFFLYGQGERAIGTYAVRGGGLSTIIPLVAIGFLAGFYFYYKEKRSYMVLSFCFVAFSLMGGKRGFIFYLPMVLSFITFMLWKGKGVSLEKIRRIRRRSFLYGLILFLVSGVFALKLLPTLNPERKIGGSIDVGHAVNYATEYTTRMKPDDPRYTSGRWATTKHVFSTIGRKGPATFFFGYGPGAQTGSRFIRQKSDDRISKDLRIRYGLTGMAYIAIEYGVLGVVTYFIFLFSLFGICVRYWKSESDPYWKAFSFGSMTCAVIMILIWGTYSLLSVTGDLFPLLFFYFMSIVIVRFNYIKSQRHVLTN